MRPVGPQTVLGGLMSCHPPAPLTGDLTSWVQAAEHGVILVSFGSVIKAAKMPEDKRLALLNTFAKLKQRVIWKWEDSMNDAPQNVLIRPWLPQTSLLGN